MCGLSCSPVVPPSSSAHECGTAPPAAALLQVLSTRLPISTPPTGLDECCFFNSLVVRLPYSSIFCQLCFFFFNCCYPSIGCVRRHSVPTYTSILAGSPQHNSEFETITVLNSQMRFREIQLFAHDHKAKDWQCWKTQACLISKPDSWEEFEQAEGRDSPSAPAPGIVV